MQVEKHLHELLYTADCVIVPGLGGFVSNTRGAFMNPAQHTFSPPFKRIAFNAALHTNDGTLAHYISSCEGVSYQEALNAIQVFVENALSQMRNSQPVNIQKVGVLSFDLEQHIQFEPDMNVNYLTASFGLETLHSPAIRREEQQAVIKQLSRKSVKKVSGWRVLELIPAAAILTLLMLNPGLVDNLNTRFASINPFASPAVQTEIQQERPAVQQTAPLPSAPAQEVETVVDSAALINELPKTVAENLEPATESKATTETPVNVAPAVHTAVDTQTSAHLNKAGTAGNYYIIGGCFSILSNAEHFVATAKAQGFDAQIIGLNDKGMHMVSIVSGSNQADVRAQLPSVKEKIEQGAWVFAAR